MDTMDAAVTSQIHLLYVITKDWKITPASCSDAASPNMANAEFHHTNKTNISIDADSLIKHLAANYDSAIV